MKEVLFVKKRLKIMYKKTPDILMNIGSMTLNIQGLLLFCAFTC